MSSKSTPKNAGRAPSFPFYASDWLSDSELRSCSMAARGLFIDLMCLMHKSKVYGKLMINGSRPEDKQVINLLRIHHKTYHKALKELLDYGVLKADDEGVYYNARMIKDKALRDQAKENGKLGGNPALTGEGVNPKDKAGVKPSSSSSSSSTSLSSNSKRATPRKPSGKGPESIAQILGVVGIQTEKPGLTARDWEAIKDLFADMQLKYPITDTDIRSYNAQIKTYGLGYEDVCRAYTALADGWAEDRIENAAAYVNKVLTNREYIECF